MTDVTTEFADVIDVIRHGMEPAVFEQPSPAVPGSIRVKPDREPRRVIVAVISFALVMAVGAPLLWVRPEPETMGAATTVAPTLPPTSVAPLWPPPPVVTDAPADALWRCGPVDSSRDGIVPLDDPRFPADLRFVIDPPIPPPNDGWVVGGREICQRPPSLVLVDRTADGRSVEAEIVVWVEEETFEAEEPPLVVPDLILREPSLLPGVERREGFTVRTSRDGSRIDLVGAIGDLPVWIVAFHLEIEEVMEAVGQMKADAEMGSVTMDDSGRFEVLRSGPVEARTFNTAILYFIGPGYDVEVRRDIGAFVPYLQYREGCRLMTVASSEAVLCTENGDYWQLAWRIDATRFALVEGQSVDFLAQVASALRPVPDQAP